MHRQLAILCGLALGMSTAASAHTTTICATDNGDGTTDLHLGTYASGHGSPGGPFTAYVFVDGTRFGPKTAADREIIATSVYPGSDDCVQSRDTRARSNWVTITVPADYGSHTLRTTDTRSVWYDWTSSWWSGGASLTFGWTDTDGDGIGDHEDACPDEDATGYDLDGDGCLDDTDGDGVTDDVDSCPDEDPATYYGYDVAADGCISDLIGSGCPLASAIRSDDTDFNNMADEWGILARGNATLSGASQGSLRVFGDGDLYSFNIGANPINPNSYAGLGDLYARSGTFTKNVRAASVDTDETVSTYGTTTESAFPGHIKAYTNALSTDLGNHNINGATVVQSWGTIEFSGTHPMMNTFDVSAADFAASTYMTITVPSGSSAVINVRGTSATFGPTGVTLSGVDATDVVYNFPTATTLDLDGVSIKGQVLAPRADIDIVTGDVTGTITGRDIDGTITQYNASFDGRACAVVDAAGGPDCSATHTVTNSWPGGYNATVTITNAGDAASSWSAGWSFGSGESVSSGWGGSWSQSGADVTVTNASWNGALGAGSSVTIGYTGSGTPGSIPGGITASCE